MHEFHFFYSHTEWNLLRSPGIEFVFVLECSETKHYNNINNNSATSLGSSDSGGTVGPGYC